MGYRIAGALLAAGLLAAVTTGCTASGSGTVTVSPGPAATTTAAATDTAGSTGTGGTNTGGGAPAPATTPAPAGVPDPGTQSPGVDNPGDGGATATPTPAPEPVAECADGQIHIRAEDISGVNPNFNGTQLIFETTGNTTSCWLRGFPAVTVWSPGDTVVHAYTSLNSAVYGQNPDHSWNDPQQITISPGQPAHAIVENTVTDNGRPCPISHTLNVIPPGLTASQPVETAAIHPCGVSVHPVTP